MPTRLITAILRSAWWPVVLSILLIVAHVVLSVFWRRHDTYDDTGYMLAILRGVSDGGVLYSEVFSQYGPFHSQAWLAVLNTAGWPVDHNHAGLVVTILWCGSAALVGWWVWMQTRRAWWALGGALWCAWSLAAFSAELAHPLSMVVFLTLLVLTAGVPVSGRWRHLPHLLGGAALAAVSLTKINIGAFAGIALGLAFLARWDRGGRLALLAAVLAAGVPLFLLSDAWKTPLRWQLGLGVCLPTLMAMRVCSATGRSEEPRKSLHTEACMWAGAFVATAAACLAVAWLQGVTWHDLRSGVWERPLKLASQSPIAPPATTWDWGVLLASATLGVMWHVPRLRANTVLWSVAAGVAALAMLVRDNVLGLEWAVASPALLWLPLAAAGPQDPQRQPRIALLSAILLAVWQGMGVFPVCGSQAAVPRCLLVAVSVTALANLCQRFRHAEARPLRWLRLTAGAGFTLGLLVLAGNTVQNHQRAVQKFAPSAIGGAEWFSFPQDQAATLRGVVENVKATEGPLFTFHGQCSLSLWTGKPFVNGFNCGHITGLLLPSELEDTFGRFRQQPRWAAVVFQHGHGWVAGPAFPLVESFVNEQTRPWLTIGDYELRLSPGHPAPAPRHAFWRDADIWQLSAPPDAVRKAKKWRLRAGGLIRASGRWRTADPPVSDGYARFPVPPDIVEALKKLSSAHASLWLCDARWRPLAGIPLAELAPAPSAP